jgi:hypothetical protein
MEFVKLVRLELFGILIRENVCHVLETWFILYLLANAIVHQICQYLTAILKIVLHALLVKFGIQYQINANVQ